MNSPETDPRVKVHRLYEAQPGNGHAGDNYDEAAAESLGARAEQALPLLSIRCAASSSAST